MAVVTAVISFDGKLDLHATADQLARDAAIYPGMDTTQLFASETFVAHGLLPRLAADRGRMAITRPDESTVLIGGPKLAHELGQTVARELSEPGTATAELPFGRWIAMRHDPVRRTVRVLNDPLGTAWLYVARTPGGFLLSGDLRAIVHAYPGALTPNYDAVLTQLAMGYVPTNATCLNEVTMLPPGSVVEFSADGSRVLSRSVPVYGDRNASLSRENKYEMLDALLAQSLRDWCDSDFSDVVVSLSGGMDSPFALAGLIALGETPRAITWGNPRSRDARVPRMLAERLGFPFTAINTPESSWDGWLRGLTSVGAIGTDWAGWADDWLSRLAEASSGVITGNAGEALTGKNIQVPVGGLGSDWIDMWHKRTFQQERWNRSSLLLPAARKRMHDVSREQLEVLVGGIDFASSHQMSMHMDLYGRQRRLTGGQTNHMGRVLAPLPFFLSRGMLDFWVNVPWEDFYKQHLYLDYATSRHGQVFDIVLAERAVDASVLRAPRRLTRRLRTRLAGRFPVMRDLLATTSNDILGNQVKFHAQIQDMVVRTAPLLEPVLDTRKLLAEMAQFPRTDTLSPFRLMNLLGVVAHLDLISGNGMGNTRP